MKIVIVGAGTVGSSLAEHLSLHDHQIAVVDRNALACDELNTRLDLLTVAGSGTSPKMLESAGVRSADMIIAVTPDDDTNLVVCALAKQYGVLKRIARIGNYEYTSVDNPIDLAVIGATDVIEPEREMARAVLNYVEMPGVTEAASFHADSVYLRGYRVTDEMPIANRTISEINELHDDGEILIVLVIRHGLSIIPRGSEVILPEDEIVAVMARETLPAFRSLVGQSDGKVKKVVLFGDSMTAAELARSLPAYAERVVFVDPDEKHGESIAENVSGIEILHGDCTNVEMLQEVHVENASFFIAAGKDAEDNIMSCLLAKAEGAREVIAVGNAGRHAKLFSTLGLDRLITPHEITLRRIVGSVLKIPIGAMLKLRNAEVEVTRHVISERSRAAGKAVRELGTIVTEPFVICSIARGDQIIIPLGETMLMAGDEILVVSQSEGREAVRRAFEGGFLGLGI